MSEFAQSFYVTIEGLKPGYLMNQFDPQELMKSDVEKGKETNKFDITEWRRKVYNNANGEIYIPAVHIEQAIFTAAKSWGRKSPRKWLQGNLILDPDEILFGDLTISDFEKAESCEQFGLGNGLVRKNSGCGLYIAQVSKGPPITVRPLVLSPWEVSFKLNTLGDKVGKEMLHEVLIQAGRYPGIGAYRPENRGKFGGFKVLEFKEA